MHDLYDLYPSSNLFGCESGLTLDDFGGLAIEGCHGHHPELCRVNGQRHLVRLVWPGTGARWLGGSVARGVVTRAQLARSRSCHLLPVISGKTFYTKFEISHTGRCQRVSAPLSNQARTPPRHFHRAEPT